jgi:glucose/arabinose dehydrogenase
VVRSSRRLLTAFAAVSLSLVAACSSGSPKTVNDERSAAPTATASNLGSVTTIAENLDVPWSIAFLPDGSALVTERSEAKIVKIAPDHHVSTVMTVPGVVAQGEGGLLGLAVSPTYATDGLIYVYYTAADDNRIVKLKLGGTPQPIVTGIPKAIVHNGGRLGFGPDGFLYASTGDSTNRGLAQEKNSLAGKILRMNTDGSPAPGNPFGNLVYTYGHRNVQGFGWTANGDMYATEFGQNTWDELNRIEIGKNYGWPEVEGKSDDTKFTNPLLEWHTDEASCSGLGITGSTIVIGCLRGERLYVIDAHPDGSVDAPKAAFQGTYGRLRAVTPAPDGTIWFSTSNRDGRGTPKSGDDKILAFRP